MKRTWTVRFDNRNKIACFVRTHFFKNGISNDSVPDSISEALKGNQGRVGKRLKRENGGHVNNDKELT